MHQGARGVMRGVDRGTTRGCARWVAVAGMLVALAACGGAADEVPPPPDCSDCAVRAVRFEGWRTVPWLGDLWPATRAADGTVYLAFGDGSGMARCLPVEGLDWPAEGPGERRTVFEVYGEAQADFCGVFRCGRADRYPLCPYTRAGVVAVPAGTTPGTGCAGVDQCLVARHLPHGREGEDVKPSSLLAIDGRIYLHLHAPSARPTRGFLAVSEDRGRHWRVVPGSPWGAHSRFRTLMFLQAGAGYRDGPRGHVYAWGVRNEIDVGRLHRQAVWLARVPRDAVADPAAWRYFAGLDDDGAPRWAREEDTAVPVPGLATLIQGAVLYHAGLRRYLFFSGFLDFRPAHAIGAGTGAEPVESGALFEAPAPWGPWARIGGFPGGYIGALLPGDGTGDPDVLEFTAAGNTVPYSLNIGRLRLLTARKRRR